MNLINHILRQREWSRKTFGPGYSKERIIDHIKKELVEVQESGDLSEWVDVILLAIDGAWRTGASPREICDGLFDKLQINERRQWPDWKTADQGRAIEHVRTEAKPCPHPDSKEVKP